MMIQLSWMYPGQIPVQRQQVRVLSQVCWILAVNNELRRMIINHESIENMTVYAREHQHMRTLKESGLVLVKEGLTTPEELMKISYE